MLSTYFHNLAFPIVHQAIGQVQQECSNNDNDLTDMMQEVLLQTSSSSSSSSVLYNNNNFATLPSPLSAPSLSLFHQELLSQKMAEQQSAMAATTSVVPSTMVQQSSNSASPITPSTSFVQISSNSVTALTDEQVDQPQNDYQLEDLAVIRLRPAKKKYGIANLTWNNFDIPELHSGTYRYILQIDMSKHCANIVATQEKFAFALLVESNSATGEEQGAGEESAAVDGWQKVNDKYGGNGLKEMTFAQFVNGLPNVLEFSLKFSVNSHEFKKKPFKFQVYFMGALIFESIPFKLVAHKDKRNDIFNKDTYGKKNVAKRAYTKKMQQEDESINNNAAISKKKSSPSKKHSRQQQQIEEQSAKKRRMSSSSIGSSSEDEHEDEATSPKIGSPASALSSATNFALTIPMQFILNNPILRQACEQHAGNTTTMVSL